MLKDADKLDSEVKDYISGNNKITEDYFKDVKDLQKNLFQEIKSKIKLDDTSLKYKDKKYYYLSILLKEILILHQALPLEQYI